MIQPAPLKRINNVLFFLVLITLILYYGRGILILLMFSIFLAMLMAPASNKMEEWGFSRVASTIVSVVIIMVVIAGLLSLIFYQIVAISEDFPNIQKKAESAVAALQEWIKNNFSMTNKEQLNAFQDQVKNILQNAGGFLAGLIKGVATFIGSSVLAVVLTFLLLLKREKYEDFFVMLFKAEQRNEMKEIIRKITKIAQQYLVGRAISIIILTVFYTIGLMVLGIKNAFLLSAIAAMVTFIPYVGPLVGGLLPFAMALITKDSFGPALGVIIVISIAQIIDNYFVTPVVIGGNVNISPFFTIFILIVGGMVWGIAGVILSIPLLGMVKIVFDNVNGLQPYAFLIGDQKDSSVAGNLWNKLKNKLHRES
ncbi:MAG TPA: AI-2E family transporter [Bacteroidales bacterium]|nr:AI-2E family transporter [Bacteroidales bacterium]